MVSYLRDIGAHVIEQDDETGKQFGFSSLDGHFGGSVDAFVLLPEEISPCPGKYLLAEFKTKKGGSQFKKLAHSGVRAVEPQHFVQISVYCSAFDLSHVVYMCANKDTDELHVEIVEPDTDVADMMMDLARSIIGSDRIPPRVSKSPDFYLCRWCVFSGVCHDGKAVDINCRSCCAANPIQNGEWGCSFHERILTSDVIGTGCKNHEPIV